MSVSGRGRRTVGNLHVLVQVMKVRAGLGSWGVGVRVRRRRVPLAELVRNQAITVRRRAHLVAVLCCVQGGFSTSERDGARCPARASLCWATWTKRKLEAQLGRTSRVTSARDHGGLEVTERRSRLCTHDPQLEQARGLAVEKRQDTTCLYKHSRVRQVNAPRGDHVVVQ